MEMTPRFGDWLDPTPVERRDGRWYKREDLFAPYGVGGINGSKLRQLIFLMSAAAEAGHDRVITAASVRSPQLSMTACVAAEFGMEVVELVSSATVEAAMSYPQVRIAMAAGAEIRPQRVRYNPYLQAQLRRLHEAEPDSYLLRYGITCGDADDEIEAFHAVGAAQVANLPPSVATLVVPRGSANTTVSVLYGLHRDPPPTLERVLLVGIGPNRDAFIDDRLAAIGRVTGLNFDDPPFDVQEVDLGLRYDKSVPWAEDGIVFHPTYEGKVMRWLTSTDHPWASGLQTRDGSTCLWIVGGVADPNVMEESLCELFT